MTSCSTVQDLPQFNSLTHPVKEINRDSQLIMAGDYDTSIQSLSKTLQNIKLILSGDAKISMPTVPESNKRQKDAPTAHPSIDCEPKEEDTTPSATPTAFEYDFYHDETQDRPSCFLETRVAVQGRGQTIETRSVSVFQHPMIVKGDCFDGPLDARLCEELSCVAIYNLALAHQLRAIAMADTMRFTEDRRDLASSKAYLAKALSLFEYSHLIFQQQKIPVRMPALHCMALVGNLGQIHHLLGDSTRSDDCHKYLLSVLMYAVDAERVRNRELSERDRHAVDGFLATVQHLAVFEDCCTAPAA